MLMEGKETNTLEHPVDQNTDAFTRLFEILLRPELISSKTENESTTTSAEIPR